METIYIVIIAVIAFIAYVLLVGGLDDVRENLILVIFSLILGAFIAVNIKGIAGVLKVGGG